MGQMATPKRVALLVNESAFGVKPDDPDRLIRLCRGVGIDVTAVERPAPAAPAGSVGGLLVVGGDGALTAGLPGAMPRSVAVGLLPRGAGTVWAREIGLPVRQEAAIRALAEGSVESMDVGRIHWPETG